MNQGERKMNIGFSGRTADEHKVPASILNQVLSGLQRAIHILAMQREEMEVRQKDRVTVKLEEKYVLLCEPLQPGSLNLAASLGDPTSDLFAPEDINAVAENLASFSLAIQAKDEGQIRRIMPDRARRNRLIEAFGRTVPKGSSGIDVQVGWDGSPFLSSQKLRPALREIAPSTPSAEEVRTVTGRFIRIDFEERKITIYYQPTGRELECFYEEAVEEMLLERRRELIQVTGAIRLDDQGLPKKIVDVVEIRELDLSRFYREVIDLPELKLRFNPPLTLEPQLVEDDQLIWLFDKELGIDVVAPTIEELAEGLNEEIAMLWRNYALADDETLSSRALELKRNLKRRISEERENG